MLHPCGVLIPVETCVCRTVSPIERPFSGTNDIYLPVAVNVPDAEGPLIERRVVVNDDVLKRNVSKWAATRRTRGDSGQYTRHDSTSQEYDINHVSHSAAPLP